MESMLGFEFSDNKVKILELKAAEQRLDVGFLGRLDLPVGSIKEGIVTEPKLVATKIETFLKENNITTKEAVLLVEPAYGFTRIVRLPSNLSDDQIRLNLEAELNQYRVFMGKEAIIDFNKLEEISEEGIKKINILFAATFKAISKAYLSVFEAAGLDLVDIDVPILSALRILDEVDIAPSTLEVTLLMLITDKQLEMCILKGNRPRFLHSVEIDSSDFDKDKAGFTERLLSMIKLVVNFYQARFVQGEEITRIVLNPLNSRYDQLHILLQEKMPRIPIQLSRPLNKISIDDAKGINPEDLKFPFSCLLGAALRIQNKPGLFNLNLLLREKTQRKNRLTQVYLFVAGLSVILGITVMFMAGIFLRMYLLQRQVSSVELKLKQNPQKLAAAISLKERKDALIKEVEEAAKITGSLTKIGYFRNIARAMVLVPQDLWLTDVALDRKNKVLVLTGEAVAEKPVFDYLSVLSASGYFESVQLTNSKGQQKGINFSIQCVIK